MTTRSQISVLRRELLEELKAEAKKHIGAIPPSLHRYYEEYKKEFRRILQVSSKDELIRRVGSERLVMVGDYHTLMQSQRTNLKILREVVKNRPGIRLAMEMVHSEHQPHLDRYLRGEFDDEQFLAAISYAETWGFRWENYRAILDFARQWSLPVYGLNVDGGGGGPGLAKRDRHAARIITRLVREYPDDLIWVIFGDLHLASGHLPREVAGAIERAGDTAVEPLLIYQNSETIYWKLFRRKIQFKVDVVQLRKSAFCIINTTPWVKLQSYIFWERNRGDLLCRLYNFCSPYPEQEEGQVDFSDRVHSLILSIAEFFHIRDRQLDSFTVLTLDDLKPFLNSLRRLKRFQVLKSVLLLEESLFIPEKRLIFLRFPDLNHAAEQGTRYLHWLKVRYTPVETGDQDEFYRRVLRQALGFLGSLLINPKRKYWHEEDHLLFLEQKSRTRKKTARDVRQLEASRRVARHLERERTISKGDLKKRDRPIVLMRNIHRQDRDCLYQISRGLGQILGGRLYYGLLLGTLTRPEVELLFSMKLEHRGEARVAYLELKNRVRGIEPPMDSKHEVF